MHRHRTASFIVCMKQEKRLPYGIESKHSYDGFVRLLERIITVSVKSIKSTWTYQKLPDTLFRNFGAYGTVR